MQRYDIKHPSPELKAFREAAACKSRAAEVAGNMTPGHVGESEAFALEQMLEDEMWRCHEAVVSQPPVTLEIIAEHSEATATLAELMEREPASVQAEFSRLQLAIDAFMKIALNSAAQIARLA
jgi:hypothetical protein